jgi:hypothetical protein
VTLGLAGTGVSAGNYGDASHIPQLTVNAQGQITAATTTTLSGSLAHTGSVTFAANATSTTVSDTNVTANSVILLTPLTADAAALESIGWQISQRTAGTSFVVTHASSPATDRQFQYTIIG